MAALGTLISVDAPLGHESPELAALATWSQAAEVQVVSVEVRGDRAEVVTQTKPPLPDGYWTYCVRRQDGWHETVSRATVRPRTGMILRSSNGLEPLSLGQYLRSGSGGVRYDSLAYGPPPHFGTSVAGDNGLLTVAPPGSRQPERPCSKAGCQPPTGPSSGGGGGGGC